MRTSYAPVQRQPLRDVFDVEPPAAERRPETWPDYAAPIERANTTRARDSVLAAFAKIPRLRPFAARAFFWGHRVDAYDLQRQMQRPGGTAASAAQQFYSLAA